MKAILLSAGYGKRLRPLTSRVPKCLVEINNNPLLKIWINKLKKIGVDDFLVNTHYLSDQVDSFIKENNYKEVKLKYEDKLLGTAGTLIKNINFFEDQDGMLIHADNFAMDSFKNLLDFHKNRPSNCLMTMVAFKTNYPEDCGIIEIDKSNIVRNFEEKPSKITSNLANGAMYILSKELLNVLKNKKISDFSTEVIPSLIGKIFVYKTDQFFTDIGNIENYKEAINKASNCENE